MSERCAMLTLWMPKVPYDQLRWNQFASSLKGSASLNKWSAITLHYVCWWTTVTNLCKTQWPKIWAGMLDPDWSHSLGKYSNSHWLWILEILRKHTVAQSLQSPSIWWINERIVSILPNNITLSTHYSTFIMCSLKWPCLVVGGEHCCISETRGYSVLSGQIRGDRESPLGADNTDWG